MDSSEIQKTLDASNELQITVTGRKTGRKHSTPIWFVREGRTIFLLPVHGSRSQWYKNMLGPKRMQISSGKISIDVNTRPITEAKKVASIVEKFQKKHGERWYPTGKFDVAVELSLP